MDTTILLSNLKFFDYSKLDTELLDIEVIAQGLSNECRYSGQCKFYSVAEHCILMSNVVRQELALEALLHDATESVLLDLPKPLKEMLPQYKEMEKILEANIAMQYKLVFPYPTEIKIADQRMRATEQSQLYPDFKFNNKLEPFKFVYISGYRPEIVKKLFLDRYEKLRRV